MNWYKRAKRKYKDDRHEGNKIDLQQLCCGFPENRRKDPHKKNKGRNYPDVPSNRPKKKKKQASRSDLSRSGVRVTTLDRSIRGGTTGKAKKHNRGLLIQVRRDPFDKPNAEGDYIRLTQWIPEDQLQTENTKNSSCNIIKASSKELILMRGLSGSGKSFLAKQLAGDTGIICSTDDFFMIDGVYQFDPKKLHENHLKNQEKVEKAMTHNLSPIVVDNTNVMAWENKNYVELAKKYGYSVTIREPESPWWKKYFSKQMSEEDKNILAEMLSQKTQHDVPKVSIRGGLDRWEHGITEESILNSKCPWEK